MWPGSCGAVQARLFRRLLRVDEPTAPVGYRAIVIAECARGRLLGHGAQPSAMAKSTVLNAADSGQAAYPRVVVK